MRNVRAPIVMLRVVFLSFIVSAGIFSILASNDDECILIEQACLENSDCCSHHCESGRCCRGIGADLDMDAPASNCCSGQIRTGGAHGPYCCATDGMVVSEAEDCCEGLAWDSMTGICAAPPCEPGCTWRSSATVVGGGECDCPAGSGTEVPELPSCTECTPCATAPPDEHYIMRVYNDDTDFCCVAGAPPFWAPDAEAAEACAREICGCVDCPTCIHCDVENVTRSSNPYMTCPMP